jgi:hypothetical protein
MTTLLLRTRHDVPPEASPAVAAPLGRTALAPALEVAGCPAVALQTVADLLAYYVAEVLPTHAPNTQYQRTRFLAMVEREYGHLPLTAITPAWLRSWRDQLGRRLKPDTVRQYVTTPPAKARRLRLDDALTLTEASRQTLEFTTSTLAAEGSVRALEHGQATPSHRPQSLRCSGCFSTLQHNFYGDSYSLQPREVMVERAACTTPVAIEASRP